MDKGEKWSHSRCAHAHTRFPTTPDVKDHTQTVSTVTTERRLNYGQHKPGKRKGKKDLSSNFFQIKKW